MDATQAISDSVLESDEEENIEESLHKRGRPLAKLCILKNPHLPETELPLFLGDNVLGRDPSICLHPLPASSVSKQHATINISVYRRRGLYSEVDMEAVVWDLGSMNGTRKGLLKLTPNVRYALSEGDSLVLADIPCHYVNCNSSQVDTKTSGSRNSRIKTALSDVLGDADRVDKECVNGGTEAKKTSVRGGCLSFEQTPTQPQGSLVPDSDSDSDSERSTRGDRRLQTQVSDSDSNKSTSNSSGFPSLPNKTIPESEDESSIMPSSSTSNRHVCFSTEKTSPGFVENSGEEEEGESAAQVGADTEESGQNVKQKSNVSFTGEDESLVSSPGVSQDPVPAFNMDSDTDVEEEEGEGRTAGSLNPNQRAEEPANTGLFHMDSDTDVEEEGEAGERNDESVPTAAPHRLDPETNVEPVCAPAASDPSGPLSSPAAAAELDILSDSDTDTPVVGPPRVPHVSASFGKMSGSDEDTDLDEPHAGGGARPAELRGDSDTDVEDEEANTDEEDENLQLKREHSWGSLAPSLQNCSTPVLVSEEVENMETQAFISPSSVAFGRVKTSALRNVPASSCSDSQEDEDYVVAETQSFLLQTRDQQTEVDPNSASGLESKADERSNRGDSFQLRLSNSSRLQCQENTQEFESAGGGGVNLEETQAYISPDYGASAENGSDLEETQAYEENGELVKESERRDGVNLAFEATQAYISEIYDDPEKDSDEDKRQNAAETTGFTDHSSALAMAETQPVHFYEEEGRLKTNNSISSVQVKPRTQTGTKEKILSEADFIAETQPMCASDNVEDDEELEEKQTEPYCSAFSLAETQPMHVSAAETQPMVLGEDDERSVPLKRKAKQLHVEEEELTDSDACIAETQPVVAHDMDDDSMPGPRKRKAKPLQLEDETQSLGDSESQPSATGEGEPGDEESCSLCPQKRKAKVLPEEEKQTLIGSQVSDASAQPDFRGEEEENDSEVLVLPRKRKAKRLHLEDEETQQLTSSEFSTAETQPAHGDEGDTTANPQTGETLRPDEGLTQPRIATEVSAVQTQLEKDKKKDEGLIPKDQHPAEETEPSTDSKVLSAGTLLKTKTNETNQPSTSKSRQTKVKLVQEKEEAECSAPLKRQSRKESKTLPKTRGRRGNAKSEDDDGEEEVKQARGRINTRRQEKKKMDDEGQQEEVGTRQRGDLKNKGKADKKIEDAERIKPDLKSEEKSEENFKSVKKEQKVKLEREREHQTGLQTENEAKEEQPKGEKEKQKVPARGRRSTRKTTAAPRAAELEPNSSVSTGEDLPARRTRSRSNSSNSISSERSASSVGTQEGRGGRSETFQTPLSRSSRRRVTVTEQNSCSSQSRARGGRQQGRGRRILSDGCGASSSENLQKSDTKGPETQQVGTSRGQQRADANKSKPSVLNEDHSGQDKPPLPKRNVRGRGQKAVTTENMEEPVTPVGNNDEGRNRRNRKKTELETKTNRKVSKDGVQKPAEEEEEDEQKQNIPVTVQVRRSGRASCAQMKKKIKEPPEEEVEAGDKKEAEPAEKKTRAQTSVVQKSKQELKESGTTESSATQTAKQPQTPTSNVSRKRRASSDASPLAKTPRSSSGSPAASGRLRAGSNAYKVLFTGVVHETGEQVLSQLGGSMAKGVADMNCLVTDKVRRTVKFLCAVAKGVPVVTTDWLEKSSKAGSFLSPHAFIVNDPEQEKKFSFCLQESLEAARRQPLLQGYKIHVTKSVQPEPVHMKEIICCSGAVFLPKMPSSHKPQTVVISCEEDWRLCGPAVSASLPVVTAEFLLTGILQQKLDFQTHALSPAASVQPAGDRGRSKRKT